eukprot:scaffold127726_cov48-Phaeocystis_antarctica.AAC.1
MAVELVDHRVHIERRRELWPTAPAAARRVRRPRPCRLEKVSTWCQGQWSVATWSGPGSVVRARVSGQWSVVRVRVSGQWSVVRVRVSGQWSGLAFGSGSGLVEQARAARRRLRQRQAAQLEPSS